MSEYWLSHKKYFCKYCEIYITDDAPSRRQHESGMRHKGNRDRYVKNIYKQGERRKKDLEEERRELARVEVAANAAFAQDVSAGYASLTSSSQAARTPQTATAAKKPERPTSVWSNYSTAQSMGITDPDEERLRAEMERRRTQGLVGEWEVVAPPPPPLPKDLQDPKEEDTKDGVLPDFLPQKREAEALLEDEEDERRFKLRKRTISAGLGEIWDPGDIPIKLKSKKKEEPTFLVATDQSTDQTKEMSGHTAASVRNFEPGQSSQFPIAEKAESQTSSGQTSQTLTGDKPKWQPTRWKRATEPEGDMQADTNEENDEPKNLNDADRSIKKEDKPNQLHHDAAGPRQARNDATPKVEPSDYEIRSAKPNEKSEETTPLETPESTGGLFKKRKVPAAARGRRG